MRTPLFLLLALPVAACPGPADDDDSIADDDDSVVDDDDVCGEPSGGSGGAPGLSWVSVPGFGDPEDADASWEMLVYEPTTADPAGAPVLMLVGRRMPFSHAENEALFEGLGFLDVAEQQGWVTILPLTTGDVNISWTDSQQDADFFDAAIDELQARWNVDRDRLHLLGSSAGGAAATYLGWRHAPRIASIVNHAGRNPFQVDPELPWTGEVAGLFIHDEADPIVSRAAIEDAAALYESAGMHVERHYAYDRGHEWVPEALFPPTVEFAERMCNE
jgi:predicted esterase